MVKPVLGFFHLLGGHIGYRKAPPWRSDLLPGHAGVGGKLRWLLLQKLRHFLRAETVNIMRRVLPVLMKHYHVGNGKAVSLKIFGVVDIETGVNIFKGSFRRKGRGTDKLIVCSLYGMSRRLKAVLRLKVHVPCGVPAG